MRLLAEISEGSLGISDQFEQLEHPYRLRKSARAILINENGHIATQYLQNYGYHKLPGGGVDQGESVEEALKREILEEVGCQCEIVKSVGLVIEYRNKYDMIHLSFCYVAKVVGPIGEPQLEEGEIEEGQTTLWLSAEDILEKMKSDIPQKFEGHFILKREIAFLEEFLKTS